jgi:hypothetical protein
MGETLTETHIQKVSKNWLEMFSNANNPTRFAGLVDGDKVVAHRRIINEVGESWFTTVFEFVSLIENHEWADMQNLDCDWFVQLRDIDSDKDNTNNVVYTITRVEIWNE